MRHHFFAAGVMFLCTAAAIAQVTAIKAGCLVDPDSGTVLTDQVILIRDHKITEVGKGLALPAGAKVIDLSSMTVLPGLIDCHTHVADGQVGGEPFNVLRKTASQIVLESVTNARKMLESGFTAVRDVSVLQNVEFVMKDGDVYKSPRPDACSAQSNGAY